MPKACPRYPQNMLCSACSARSTVHIAIWLKKILDPAQFASTSVESMFCTYRSKKLTQPAWKIAQTSDRQLLRVFPTIPKICQKYLKQYHAMVLKNINDSCTHILHILSSVGFEYCQMHHDLFYLLLGEALALFDFHGLQCLPLPTPQYCPPP